MIDQMTVLNLSMLAELSRDNSDAPAQFKELNQFLIRRHCTFSGEPMPTQVVVLDSRFEYDLNRSAEKAIPLTPEMAWGLTVWNSPLTEEGISVSLAKYREFHLLMDLASAYLVNQADSRGGSGRTYIFDLHSYCYQREQREPWYENMKPVINLGTDAINDAIFREAIADYFTKAQKNQG